jgi:hypothetical protein
MIDDVKKKVGVTLPTGLHADVKAEAAKRRMTTEAAYEHALRGWLGASAAPPASGKLSPQVADYLDFLETGNPELVRVVKDFIATHAKHKRAQERVRKAG